MICAFAAGSPAIANFPARRLVRPRTETAANGILVNLAVRRAARLPGKTTSGKRFSAPPGWPISRSAPRAGWRRKPPAERFRYSGSSLFASRGWIGEGFDRQRSALGYSDDRHVCLVSGTRGGKGAGVIIPNLCFWPGSCIVVDPKGENAAVTARRRGNGSEYAHGIGQKVCILDPFGEVNLPPELKARYNPLDAIDPESDYAIDDAARVAAALLVQSQNDPYWELAARNLLKGLILHVLSAPYLRAAQPGDRAAAADAG